MSNDSSPGEEDNVVKLYIYDLSKGLANLMSVAVLGKHIEGVWHSAIIVYGREYFYGAGGIESCRPGGTVLGKPDKMAELGKTQIPYSLFLEFMFALGEASYKPANYHLLEHNCNDFSQEVAQFLTGQNIPEYVRKLPDEIRNTSIGATLSHVLESVNLRPEGSRGASFGQQAVQEAQRRTTFKAPSRNSPGSEEDEDIAAIMATISKSKEEGRVVAAENAAAAANGETDDVGEKNGDDDGNSWEERLAAKRAQKNKDPPICFKDVDAEAAFAVLETNLKDKLNEDDTQSLLELKEFILADSGAWALGGQHLEFVTRVLTNKECQMAMLQFLQAAALKEDVILLLHMDRKEHILMNFLNNFEKIDPEEQVEIGKFLCNLCLPYSSSDWLLYISEWQDGTQTVSNSKVTTRVAVNSLLSENPNLQQTGVALMYNMGLKEVFDDTATELASAILQFLQTDVAEDPAFKVLTALHRFLTISYKDVPALVKMMGPDLGKFKGKSDRLDHLIEQVTFKVNAAACAEAL